MTVPAHRATAERPGLKVRRLPSQTPAARRQRKARARRKAGLALFCLCLPLKRLEAVVRAREHLPANAVVTKRQIRRVLVAGIDWWSAAWIALKRDNARHT